MNKISKFLKKNRFEKQLFFCRNTYRFLHKRSFAQIGKKSFFLRPLFLAGTKYISMGEETGIWHHARVEVIDQWYDQVFQPKLTIGSRVNIGQDLHIACAGNITIEDDVLISAGVFITDLSHETSDAAAPVIQQGITVKSVRICEGAFIGRGVSILPGVTIGRHSVVGSNAVVTKDVPDFAVVCGVPAKKIQKEKIYE